MQKKLWTLIIVVTLIFVSCSLVKREKYKNTPTIEQAEWVENVPTLPMESNEQNKQVPIDGNDPQEENNNPSIEFPPSEGQQNQPKKAVTHYDIEALDRAVREDAKRQNVAPEKHRKLYDVKPGNVKIYRMIGTFVIEDPMEPELMYLPDEL